MCGPTTPLSLCPRAPLRRWQNQAIGRTCSSGATDCLKPLASVSGTTTGISTFIAAAGFLFLNNLQSTFVSNFTYDFSSAAPPTLTYVQNSPPVQNIDDSGEDMTMTISMAMWKGSTTSVQDSSGNTITQGSSMGNTYSKTQSLSFSPPKIHATIGKSSTQQSAQEQTWGYSSTQQTSYTQTSQVASKSSWSETWPLAYGNILYLVGEQYYGNLGTVPFVGINNLTFEACNIVLCENAGVSTTFTPSVQQLIYGGFTGVYYTTALVVSAGSFASD